MAKRIEVRVPVRVDLAGGWTDVQPYTSDYGGEVVNFTIDKYIKCSMEKDDEGKKKVEYTSDVPTGSGLGTSGAMNVGLIATIAGEGKTPEDIAELAFRFEELLENKGGRQDQWASAKGGFNHLLFIGDEVEPLPFEPMRSAKNWLLKHFIILYSGIEHNSGKLHKEVWGRYRNGDEEVLNGLHLIRKAARTMANGLQQDRREMVVESLREVCKGVDMIDLRIHEPFNSVIQPLIESKKVIAWKALGAGGGGSVGLLCAPNSKELVIESAKKEGWMNIEWGYDDLGIVVDEIN
mgnify:FL=1|tara:strand:+ start:14051 stop:14929 length:879 start_codon:yes stop_codon:yes gene_type:complete